MTPSKLILDMDGVLIDSKAALIQSYKHTSDDFNIPPRTGEFELALGGTLEEIFGKLHASYSAELLSAHFRRVSEHYPIEEFAGAKDFIDYLNGLGIPVDIVTNKDFQRATKIAKELGFSVNEIWSPSNGFKPKPDSDMLLRAFGELPASKVMFVGDTKTDLLAAVAAGCSFVHATWGYESTLSLPLGFREATSFQHLREIIA
jgi:phosphoglycolate phosphatase